MSLEEIRQRIGQGQDSSVLPLPPYEDDRNAWLTGELLRLSVPPALVTLFLVGGVYWISLQKPAGLSGQQQSSVVQVRLIPRPDSAPIVTAPATDLSTQTVLSSTETSSKEPDATRSDDPAPVPRARMLSPAEAPPSNVLSSPSAVSGPASSVAANFQRALLSHVAQYQRYPNAARSLQLQGRVDTQFAMGRDGQLLGVWVRTSSGQRVLDREAIETIRRAQPLPRIPPELPDRLTMDVQLVFDPS